ncbi:MAG TPA: SDR family oxidoreductase [Fulvivirga sp.]|nr:SDR family oxidoreductase [Fulvivirga sp.]
MTNKVVMVVGGASGIGLALIHKLIEREAKVIVLDIKQPGLKNDAVVYFHCDVKSEESVKNAVEKGIAHFGKLDIAVNNAGIGGEFNPVHQYSTEDWNKVMAINLTGVFLCMKYQLAYFAKNNAGSIVNTASLLSIVGYANDSAYVASKHAVVGLTKSAALEYASMGIRVNCVSPGFTDTPMTANYDMEKRKSLEDKHALGRFAKMEEIAESIMWLGNNGTFITGHNLVVDGGYTVS